MVDGVSFSVPEGSVTGLLGANGAGKTTVLRLMLGLVRGEGTTDFLGRPLPDWHRPGEIVGAVLGGTFGHPRHRLRDHLTMVAYGLDVPPRHVTEVLTRVGLEKAADQRLGQLSLGMAQRAGLAQALLGDPRVLILDEPFNGLDPHSIAWLRGTLRSFAEDGGTVLLSSHLLGEMDQLADRILVMARGRLVAQATAAEIAARVGRHAVVETPELERLTAALTENGAGVERLDSTRARVTGLDRREVGKLAARLAVPLYWLGEEAASVEDFYLSVAEEEFKAR
ncbi:ABC transporter ATP-binding protein [Streptomyces sp. URMC 126]|uniref:ABC transporter ATP-binding protein n=1 Tax=Streptomyces sp. URMC 126 TaxID=3423401 RepID=UPI003F1A9165